MHHSTLVKKNEIKRNKKILRSRSELCRNNDETASWEFFNKKSSIQKIIF